jgi:hypothetical protein
MTIRSITGTAGIALGLAMMAGVALAQTGPHLGGYPSPATQQQIQNTPGYSVGTGSARIGGYPSAATQQQIQNTPGYSVGTGSSRTWPDYCYTVSPSELSKHAECRGAPHE